MKLKRILLIDDDDDDRQLFTEAVEVVTQSAVVTVIDNAVDALRKLAAKEIVADVIFLDLNMPLMRGDEFLALIRKDAVLGQIPVIILSTSSGLLTQQAMTRLGAQAFITKPATFDGLVTVVRTVLK